jgi:hypothetical protein
MQKKLLLCALLTIFAVSVVYGLFLLSRIPANKSNHFSRQLPPHILTEEGELIWSNNPWRLAGSDDKAFYIAHRSLLNVLMRVGVQKMDTTLISIRMAGDSTPQFNSAAWLSVDSSRFFLADGKKGEVYNGNNITWNADRLDNHIPFFDKMVIFNKNMYFRGIRPGHGFLLGRRNTSNQKQTLFPNLLEKQEDGFFDEDGILLKDSYYSRIIYLYRYRNQFLVADTALNLLYRGKTIDTVAHVQIKLGRTNQGKEIKMATPPPTVNQDACISNGYLFVHSALRADNEQVDLDKEASVIDVYDLQKGDYRFSFYISNSNHEKIRQFSVNGNLIAAMYPHRLKLFRFENNFFSH